MVEYDWTVPVAIIGGGACGLVAALAAHDAGAEVIVFERDHECHGSSGMSLGALCAAGTKEQASFAIADDEASFLADIMEKTGGRADPTVAALIARQSGPTLDWLAASHGVNFELDREWRPAFGHTRQRMHAVPERTGYAMMQRLVAACQDRGILILNDACVSDIDTDATGTVSGVRLARPDGSIERIGCHAVVLATCGFAGNADMVSRYIPSIANARYFGWEGNRGDGITWARNMDAAIGDMDAYQGLGLLAEPQGIDVNPKLLIEGGIQINTQGHRFSDELGDVSGQAAVVIAQPGSISWVVYDERIHHACRNLPQYKALLELGARRSGEDIASLAQVIKVPAPALQETLEMTAAAAQGDMDDPFGRSFDRPAMVAPYHALCVTGALFHTQGGLNIDAQARVVKSDGTSLPNLLAGGGAARGPSGPGPSGYLPGMGLCAAVTLGAIAGRSAADIARRAMSPINTSSP